MGHAGSLNSKFSNSSEDSGCLPGGPNASRGFESFFGLPYSHEEGYPGPAPEGDIWPPVPLIRDREYIEAPFN